MNKRGTDKILSVYWFFILVLVAGGVFAMVYIFYSAPYDVREIESYLLANKIADCISRGGRINPDFFNKGVFNSGLEENLLDKCKITFNVEEGYGETETHQYFFEIEFYRLNALSVPNFSLSEGNINWKTDCFIKKKNEKDYEALVKCTERRFYAVDGSSNQYLIKILSGVGKSEKNVKL